jgi:hypothetical protein
MKLPIKKLSSGLNTPTMVGISLLWGQMLGLLNPWYTILTVFCLLIGYGNEIILKRDQ